MNQKQLILSTTICLLFFFSACAKKDTLNYSDEEIKVFMRANSAVYEIQEQAAKQVQASDDLEAKKKVAIEFTNKAKELVKLSGLDFETYNAMVQEMQNNEAFKQRIAALYLVEQASPKVNIVTKED